MDDKTIYEQHCESCRYQDSLRWNYFKTISVIEGAMLYIVYMGNLEDFMRLIISIVGSLLIIILTLLSRKDHNDGIANLAVVKHFEKEIFEKNNIKFRSRKVLGLHGSFFIMCGLMLINILNIFVLLNII